MARQKTSTKTTGKPKPASDSHRKFSLVFGPIAILAFSFFLYGSTIGFDYAHDDIYAIKGNKYSQQGLEGIPKLLSTNFFAGFFGEEMPVDLTGGRYRPLSLIMIAIETEFFGMNPHVGHLFNILWYALCGWFIVLVLRDLLPKKENQPWYFEPAFLGSLIFLAHPVHTEVVANIKGRDEILALVLSLLATWIAFRPLPNYWKWIMTAAAFFLALMAKENSIAFLFLIPLALFLFAKPDSRRKALEMFIPLFFATITFFGIRYSVLGNTSGLVPKELMDNPFLGMDTSTRFATIFLCLGIYLKLLFFPHPLTWDYYPFHIPASQWSDPWVLVSLIAMAGLIVLSLYSLKKQALLGFAGLVFLGSLFIVSNIPFSVGVFMAERFLFMPSLGMAIAASWVFHPSLLASSHSKKLKPFLLIATGLVLIAFSWKTLDRNPVWKDNFSLYTTDVLVSQNSAKGNNFAGQQYAWKATQLQDTALQREYRKKAIAYLNKALSIHPRYKEAWYYLGNAHFDLNQNYRETYRCYREVLSFNPNEEQVFENFGKIMPYISDLAFKEKMYKELYSMNPERFETNFWLGSWYAAREQAREATPLLEICTRLKPLDSRPYNYLGVLAYQGKEFEKAKAFFNRSLELSPGDPTITRYLGACYEVIGNREKAMELYARSEQLSLKTK